LTTCPNEVLIAKEMNQQIETPLRRLYFYAAELSQIPSGAAALLLNPILPNAFSCEQDLLNPVVTFVLCPNVIQIVKG
jgi:hypothetical protein